MKIYKAQYTQKLFEQYQISITDCGYADADCEWHDNNVCSPYSRLYYPLEGCGYLILKGQKIALTPGHLYLIPLGTFYHYYCEDTFRHLYFHINIDAPNGYDLLREACFVEAPIPQEKAKHLLTLYQSNRFCDQMELKYELFRSIQILLSQQPIEPTFDVTLSPEIIKSIEYIREHLSLQLTTAEIAQNLYLSKNTLAKQFREEVGLPIGRYIDKLIFFQAERLLSKSSLSIKEISDNLGFCDQFYFSRKFQQHFEETPLAYRKRTKSDTRT